MANVRPAPFGKAGFGLVALLALISCALARAAQECVLRGGESIVFFGDSITQGGGYVEHFEAFLAARFPDKTFRVINSGISSETISGTSETDHRPRRPWAHKRFDRDVAAYKPDIVVACFGMNDGNYHPFERLRFQKFKAGVRLLIERTQRQTKARLALMTPPPFDPYRRRVGDKNAKEYGYKFPAIDYDHTLEVYSQWLVALRREGMLVADAHTALNEHLRARRKTQVSFYLAGDAVHPNATGHWLMAQTLLETLGVPPICAEVELDAARRQVRRGNVTKVAIGADGGLAFSWTSPLPPPMDSRWDKESIALEKAAGRFGRCILKVTGLPAKRYRLEVDGKTVAETTAEDLAKGLDLTALPKLPINQAASHVLGLVQRRRRAIYKAWRSGVATGEAGAAVAATEKAEKETADLAEKIRSLSQPRQLHVKLLPQR